MCIRDRRYSVGGIFPAVHLAVPGDPRFQLPGAVGQQQPHPQMGPGPVSYTHLDVYKRQALGVGDGDDGVIECGLDMSGSALDVLADVYKRQGDSNDHQHLGTQVDDDLLCGEGHNNIAAKENKGRRQDRGNHQRNTLAGFPIKDGQIGALASQGLSGKGSRCHTQAITEGKG